MSVSEGETGGEGKNFSLDFEPTKNFNLKSYSTFASANTPTIVIFGYKQQKHAQIVF